MLRRGAKWLSARARDADWYWGCAGQLYVAGLTFPRVHDRSRSGIYFHSGILPPYLRCSKSIEEVLPWLYLIRVPNPKYAVLPVGRRL